VKHGLSVQTLSAFDAEAVPAEVVVSARRAYKPARRVSLQPALALSSVPDPVLGAEHPSPPLAVEDREVTHGEPERSGLEPAVAALLDQMAIAGFRVSKWIDGHAKSIANPAARCPVGRPIGGV
jgi:hypothetical protein